MGYHSEVAELKINPIPRPDSRCTLARKCNPKNNGAILNFINILHSSSILDNDTCINISQHFAPPSVTSLQNNRNSFPLSLSRMTYQLFLLSLSLLMLGILTVSTISLYLVSTRSACLQTRLGLCNVFHSIAILHLYPFSLSLSPHFLKFWNNIITGVPHESTSLYLHLSVNLKP